MLQFGKNSIKNEKVASPGFELVTKRVVNCSSTTGAYGLFGDDVELSTGVLTAAGKLERGVAAPATRTAGAGAPPWAEARRRERRRREGTALVCSVAGHGEDKVASRGEDGDGIAIPAVASSTTHIFSIVRRTQQTLLAICCLHLEQENEPVPC